MEFYASKCDGVLIGVSEDDQQKIAGLGRDTVVKCETNKNRNYKNLQRFMVFIGIAFDMQEKETNIDSLRTIIEIRAGHYIVVGRTDSTFYLAPKSISFEKMTDEEEFKAVFKKCIDAYLNWRNETHEHSLSNEEFMTLLDFD